MTLQGNKMKNGYSQLTLDLASINKIYKVLSELATSKADTESQKVIDILNIPGLELHTTLMYDKRDPDIIPGINRKTYKASVTGVERLGRVGGKHYALVLLVDSDAIQERFLELKKLGFQHSFPDLKLHVSLHYGDQVDLAYPLVKEAFDKGLLPKEITFGGEAWNACR